MQFLLAEMTQVGEPTSRAAWNGVAFTPFVPEARDTLSRGPSSRYICFRLAQRRFGAHAVVLR